MPKISVIIPVYNTEKYLKKCLDSVLAQTLSDIEIICINDGSNDNSFEILKEYLNLDKRIKLINFDSNKGTAEARNEGIKAASGEFIGFVDSDDFPDPDFYQKLYNKAIKTGADCAKGCYKSASDGYVDKNLNLKINENKTNFAYAFCSAVFKRKILIENNLYFPNLKDMEDPVFTLKFALLANRVETIDTNINIVKRTDSETNSPLTKEKLRDRFSGLQMIVDILNNSNVEKESYTYVLAFWFYQSFFNSINNSPEKSEYITKNILKILNGVKHKKEFIKEIENFDKTFAKCIENKNFDLILNKKRAVFSALRQRITKKAVSVIIPVFNAEKYLKRCLDSVCTQTLKNIEIICINDGSADNSLQILKEFGAKDERIKIIDCKENGGESKARNLGLNEARGEFIAFVDNDDFIDPDFYEKLYKKAKETGADISKGNTVTTDYGGLLKDSDINPKIKETKNKWHFHFEWWSAIYRSDIIKENNIRLPEGYILGGDVLFLNEVLYFANKVETVNDTSYHWIRRKESGDSLILSKEKISSALKIYEKIQTNNNKRYKNNETDKFSYGLITKNCLWIPLEYIFRNDEEDSKKLCAEYLIKYYKNCLEKDIADDYLKTRAPYLFTSILNDNKKDVIDKILNIKTRKDFENKNTFAKLRNKTIQKSPLVSVIIPVYNVEKYLERCLKSTICQTYKNLEIICVNDASLDNSLSILKKYAALDKRIKPINQTIHVGVSAARNLGLNKARGKYIYFIDSDDWIDPPYIEKMVENIEKAGTDIVFNSNIIEEHKDKTVPMSSLKCGKRLSNVYIEGDNTVSKSVWNVWCHIYKKEFLDKYNLKFPEGYIYEDILFSHAAKYYAKRFYAFFGPEYHYSIRKNSIMTTKRNVVATHIKMWNLVKDFYKNISPNKNLEIKMFEPEMLELIQNDEEFSLAKEFLSSMHPYIKEKYHLFFDYDKFVMNNILNSNSYSDYKNKAGKFSRLTYITRYKIQRGKHIKVSIIIPIFNTEKYLEKCLDSICNQTLEDIEIICINDGSDDSSLEILKEYSRFDNRIKIINFNKNKGPAVARNEGIKVVAGEFIGFVDSDDFVDLDFYQKLYNKALETKSDVVKGSFEIYNNVDNYLNDHILKDKNLFIAEFASAIYKTSFIKENSIFFPSLYDMEDPVFSFKASVLSNNVSILNDAIVQKTARKDSLSAGIPSFDKISEKLKGLKMIIEIANNSDNLTKESFLFIVNYWLETILAGCLKNNDPKCKRLLYEKMLDILDIIKYKEDFYKELATVSKETLFAFKNRDYSSFLKCAPENFQADLVFKRIRHKMAKANNTKKEVQYV